MTKLSRDIQKLVNRRGLIRARDGAIIDPVVDETNGIQWFFQYRKNSPGKYKWIAMGRQEDINLFSNSSIVCTPINTYILQASAISIPFNGMYIPRTECLINSTASVLLSMGIYLNTVVLVDNEVISLAANETKWFSAEQQAREFTATSQVQIAMSANVLGVTSTYQYLKLRPTRINV